LLKLSIVSRIRDLLVRKFLASIEKKMLVEVRNSLSLEGFPLKGLGRRALMRGS
jgi:hypothetical protein